MKLRTLILVGCLTVAGIVGATGAGLAAPTAADAGPGAVGGTVRVEDAALADGSGGSAAAVENGCSFPVSMTDTTGTEVTVEERPERIVALQPSDAQTVWAIGAQDRVVGMDTTQYTSYLSGRSGKRNVKNDDLSVNVEQVIGLQPDVVLAANVTDVETVRQLRSAGITVYHFGKVRSLDEIARNVETVGRLTGTCGGAREAATDFRLSVARARNASERAEDHPDVLYYFFDTTTGSGTHIHDVIESAGGNNVAADAGIEGYAAVNTEIVVDRDPEWIVYPDDATLPNSAAFNGTTAYQRNQTVALQYNYISQPGPRVAIPLTHLARTLHPEELDAANESVNRSDVRETATNATTTNAANATATNGPGFGATAGLAGLALALAVIALLARRAD